MHETRGALAALNAFLGCRDHSMVGRREGTMSEQERTGTQAATSNGAGVYLAVLQLVFTLGWVTYVIYLPKLAADVGIAPTVVICHPDARSGDLHRHRYGDGSGR